MAGVAALSAYKFISKSERSARTTKAAWASYVRNRWATNTLAEIMREFPLSEGEARRLLYADGSQAVFDKCMDSPNGGPLLALDMLLVKWRLSAEDLAQRLEEKHERDRLREEALREPERRFSRVLAAGPGLAEKASEGLATDCRGDRP
jgi:hypothetical protein